MTSSICLCQPTPLHEVAYVGMVSKGFLREPTRCRLCLRGYDSLLFPIVAWCLAVQLGCWELLLGRWWRRGSRRSRGGRRLTLQLTNAKVNGFQLLSTSVYAKPTPCRLNQAYATAYPTYAVCMEAYATGILKHVLSSSHSIYCLASRKKNIWGAMPPWNQLVLPCLWSLCLDCCVGFYYLVVAPNWARSKRTVWPL